MMPPKWFFIMIAGLSLFLTGCYSDGLFLNYDIYPGARWNNDHTHVVFVASRQAFRKAKGLSAFPDGGRPKYLVNDVALYLFDPGQKKLTRLVDFNDLAGVMRNRWRADLSFNDSLIYYRIVPHTDWEFYSKNVDSQTETSHIEALKNKYSRIYAVNPITKILLESDAVTFTKAYEEVKANDTADLTELNKKVSHIPVIQWGLRLQDIYPKSDTHYIDTVIYGSKGGSSLTKRAIIEQIVSQKSVKEIREIIQRMDNYKNRLEGLKKTEYELYSKEAYALMLELL